MADSFTNPSSPNAPHPPVAPVGDHLAHLLVGSEGTLAFIKDLTLKLVPLPRNKVLGVVNFSSFHTAMDSAQHIVKLGPSAVELVDRIMIELALSNPVFRPTMESALIGKPDFTNLFWIIKAPEGYAGPMTYEALNKAGATVFGYGAFLTAFINFVLLAFAIFWLVKFINKAKGDIDLNPAAPAPATPEDVLLLREIRDALHHKA